MSEAPQFPRELVIRASAGTGKTFQLSGLFIRRVFEGAVPDHILATTFTRKAAAEILERILIRLARASLDADELKQLAGNIRLPGLTRKTCDAAIAQLTHRLHRLRVCTLDAFFGQLASSCSLELGLTPGWTVADELTSERLTTQAIERLLQSSTTGEIVGLIQLLNRGAASRSVSQLIRETVTQLHRVYRMAPADAWNRFPSLSTLDQEARDELIVELWNVVYPPDKRAVTAVQKLAQALEQRNWKDFFKGALVQSVIKGDNKFYRKELSGDLVELVRRAIAEARAGVINDIRWQTEATRSLLEQYDACYSELQAERGILQFDDVAHALASSGMAPSGTRLSYRLDAELDHLFLDEFQDTSLEQWEVLSPFVREIDAHADRTVFCVGDVKQAIYGWRGGVAEVFDAIELLLTDGENQPLDCSYRSAPVVIDAVNRVFEGIENLRDLKKAAEGVRQWCAEFNRHTSARTELSGHVTLKVAPELPSGTDDEPVEDAGNPNKAERTESVLQFTADEVTRLAQAAPQATIGVLTRTNHSVGRMIGLLRERGIVASEEGGTSLTDSAAVQLILSICEFADHPDHLIAHFHAATSPLAGILQVDRNDGPARRQFAAARIRAQLLDLGYDGMIEVWYQQLKPCVSEADRRRLQQLLVLADEYQRSATLRPTDFVRFVELRRVADPTSDRIRVMTVHQSKGLQFDIVFLCELEQDLVGQLGSCYVGRPTPTSPPDLITRRISDDELSMFPSRFQETVQATVNGRVKESLCVFYVALTRAIHALHLVIPPLSSGSLASTPAGLVAAALAPGQPLNPGTTLYEDGDAEWWHGLAVATDSAKAELEHCPAIRFKPREPHTLREREVQTPSGLEGGRSLSIDELLAPSRSVAMDRGTLIHGWLEQIEWWSGAQEPRFPKAAIAGGLTESQVSQFRTEFTQMLEQPRLQQLLSRSEYTSADYQSLATDWIDPSTPVELRVENECRFVVPVGDQLLSGSIDRLVLITQQGRLVGADVIDFKTDGVTADGLSTSAAYYAGQLQGYREAVMRLYQLPRESITTRLFFLACDTVRAVEPTEIQSSAFESPEVESPEGGH